MKFLFRYGASKGESGSRLWLGYRKKTKCRNFGLTFRASENYLRNRVIIELKETSGFMKDVIGGVWWFSISLDLFYPFINIKLSIPVWYTKQRRIKMSNKVLLEVIPEGELYEKRYEKSFPVDCIEEYIFYTRGKYPSRVMFRTIVGLMRVTIHKVQMSEKEFLKLFPLAKGKNTL